MAILSYEALQRRFESKPDLRDFLDTAYYWRTRPEPNKRQVSGKMQIDQPNTAKAVAGAGNGTTPPAGTTTIVNQTTTIAASLPLNQVAIGDGLGNPLKSNKYVTVAEDWTLALDRGLFLGFDDELKQGHIRGPQSGFQIKLQGSPYMTFGAGGLGDGFQGHGEHDGVAIWANTVFGEEGDGAASVTVWGGIYGKDLDPEKPVFARTSDKRLYSRRLEETDSPWTRGASVAAGTIMIGDPVAATGQDFGVLAMNTALAATPARSWMLGVSAEGGYPGEISGYVRRGPVEFDTQAFTGAAGSQLWLQPAGGLNTTKPSISNATRNVIAGTLLVKAELGKIYVDPVNFPFLHELSGVSAASPTDKQILSFSTASNRWENRSLTSADISGGPWLPLVAGPSSPLAGTLHGTSLNFAGWAADAPIAVAMNYSNAFAHAITVVNFGLTAGQRLTVDFGQSAYTNNQANFGFVYAGSGSTANKITLGLYGNNDLVTIAGTGVMTVRDLGTGFVRATSGVLSASALVAADIPALDAGKITTGTFPDARIASSATWNGKLSTVTADTTSRAANTFYAAPNGTTGAATFRAIAVADVPTLNQNTTGSAAKWTTPRTLTIGATGKTIDGTENRSWTLAEIGAQPAGSYHPLENQRLSTGDNPTFASATIGGGVIRRHALYPSTQGAIYGSGVEAGDANYSLLWTTNGDAAVLAGSTSVFLRAGGSERLWATSSGVRLYGTTTLDTSLNGLLKATSGVVSAASSADLPGGPYLPLAAGSIHAPGSYSASGASLAIGDAQYGLSAYGGTLYLWAAPGGSVVSPRSFTCLSGIYAAGAITAGPAQMSQWVASADFARFGHSSRNLSSGFGYLQQSNGNVYLEAPTGGELQLRINGLDVVGINGAGAVVTGTLSVSGLSTLAGATITANGRLTLVGGESNNVANIQNDNGVITTNNAGTVLASIRQSLSFRWYSTDWQIGNIRGGSTDSAGFGITVDNNNLRWRVTNGTTYDYNALVVSGSLAWGGGGAIASSSNVVRGENSTRTTTADWTTALPSGFYDNAAGTPTGGWCHAIIGRHTNAGNNYQSQIVTDFESDRMWFRRIHNGSVNMWREFWHTGNLSSSTLPGGPYLPLAGGEVTGPTTFSGSYLSVESQILMDTNARFKTPLLNIYNNYIVALGLTHFAGAPGFQFDSDVPVGIYGQATIRGSAGYLAFDADAKFYPKRIHITATTYTLPVVAVGETILLTFDVSACQMSTNSTQSVTWRSAGGTNLFAAASTTNFDAFGYGTGTRIASAWLTGITSTRVDIRG